VNTSLSRKANNVLGRTSGSSHEKKHGTEGPTDKTRGEAKSTSICRQDTPWMKANARPYRKPPRYRQDIPLIRGRDKLSKTTDSSGKEEERRGNKRQETPGQKTTQGEPKTQGKRCPHIFQACSRGGLCGPRKQSRRPGPKKHPSSRFGVQFMRLWGSIYCSWETFGHH
jgi:hypothetical protein